MRDKYFGWANSTIHVYSKPIKITQNQTWLQEYEVPNIGQAQKMHVLELAKWGRSQSPLSLTNVDIKLLNNTR